MTIVDDHGNTRICTGVFGDDHCDHGISLETNCGECEVDTADKDAIDYADA